ncbi:MAG: peptidase U32 family protein [Desulfocapsaceae bacterium]|nr:peptidase U32 family protein [Desulfocapsaceae bacterium]
MELLAPAGNVDNFYAALQAGADAVYLGAPGVNARNLSRDLTFIEIAAMIEYAHEHEKKVYLAANSLILERDLSGLIKTISLLDALKPDGIIVQDLGLLRLLNLYFPYLKLHASTLMGVCTSSGVNSLAVLGCQRVVLARELTLNEILSIKRNVSAELEIFVHGAMCYSFSGYCLFSSFLGGKSGMRGRCVQPCRREYGWQGQGRKKKGRRGDQKTKGGSYVFSMNDLAGFEAVAKMKEAGIASVKIEGRLRSANYVSRIVEAYRIVIDADEGGQQLALHEAAKLAEAAMSRKTSPGYFFSPQPLEAITPHRSGNMGIHLGNFSPTDVREDDRFATLTLKAELAVGDRLRLHYRNSGQRQAFTLHRLLSDGEDVEVGSAGNTITLKLPPADKEGSGGPVDLFKLDVAENPEGKKILAPRMRQARKTMAILENKLNSRIHQLQQRVCRAENIKLDVSGSRRNKGRQQKKSLARKSGLELWLKTDSVKLVTSRLPFSPDKLLLVLHKKMFSQSATIKKYLGKRSRDVVWALPPIILEKDLSGYAKHIDLLVRSGFRSFQLGHLGQQELFSKRSLYLYGDYTLNAGNGQTLHLLSERGFIGSQIGIELDRDSMAGAVFGHKSAGQQSKHRVNYRGFKVGLTVYGTPPLFTSRLLGKHMQLNKTLVSPKNERFLVKKRDGLLVTVPEQPFSLLPYKGELQAIGFDYMVVDTTLMNTAGKEMEILAERINGTGKYRKLPTFNYLGRLE